MIVLLDDDGQPDGTAVTDVTRLLEADGLFPAVGRCDGKQAVVCDARLTDRLAEQLDEVDGVLTVHDPDGPHQLTSRAFRAADTTVAVGDDVVIGGPEFVLAAGPCAVEDPGRLDDVADVVRTAGASVLRGGAFKPRTSPYSFQGLGGAALRMLAETRGRTGMPVVTEVLDTDHLSLVATYADMLQIGARNMQNYTLLREAGRMGLPVLLKRGLTATVAEWLHAAEYVLCGGADVVLCERGIRTFEAATRFTLDVSAIPVVKRISHLPVIVDPSHAAGDDELVTPLAMAAVAAGADGLLVDVHTDSRTALCDGPQALDADGFDGLVRGVDAVLGAVGRTRAEPAGVPDPLTAAAGA